MVVSVAFIFIMVLMGKRHLILMAIRAMTSVAMIHCDDLCQTSAITHKAPSHSKHLRPEHCKSAEHKKES